MNADEIVSALRCCNRSKGHRCSECPVFSRYEHRICKATVDRFAADLIESLQAQLEQKTNEAEGMRSNWYKCIENLKESQRRADASVRGEWIVTDAYPHRVYCSLCYKTNVLNEEWLYEKNDYPKYCMWCGAKMESEGNA